MPVDDRHHRRQRGARDGGRRHPTEREVRGSAGKHLRRRRAGDGGRGDVGGAQGLRASRPELQRHRLHALVGGRERQVGERRRLRVGVGEVERPGVVGDRISKRVADRDGDGLRRVHRRLRQKPGERHVRGNAGRDVDGDGRRSDAVRADGDGGGGGLQQGDLECARSGVGRRERGIGGQSGRRVRRGEVHRPTEARGLVLIGIIGGHLQRDRRARGDGGRS
ncbi:MAG TPA: hypothetical protein VI300_02340, partial [Solirubrobacter sp.]